MVLKCAADEQPGPHVPGTKLVKYLYAIRGKLETPATAWFAPRGNKIKSKDYFTPSLAFRFDSVCTLYCPREEIMEEFRKSLEHTKRKSECLSHFTEISVG